jgi:hypothetical protein
MQTLSTIPIVLTATITPNGVDHAVQDPEIRKAEYIRSLNFYSSFSDKIFFLENSAYPIHDEPAFSPNNKVHLRKLPTSADPSRGKGFQEFEMLDTWIMAEQSPPPRWLKISGRYLIQNIAQILSECARETQASTIIDQSVRSRTARTQIFYETTEHYRQTIKGIYYKCDDRTGDLIERVLFERLAQTRKFSFRFFKHRPQIVACSGTTGKRYPSNAIGGTFKQILRSGNRLFERQYLWFLR